MKDRDWLKTWCVDVHNIASSKKLYWIIPLEVSEGFTQDIPKFPFHIWEPIWYFKNSKSPKHSYQPGSCMGFEDLIGDKICYYIMTEGKKP